MPVPMPPSEPLRTPGVDIPASDPAPRVNATPTPFPVRTKQAVGMINGIRTDVTAMQFTEKIMITMTQEGRLGHWVHVPLESSDPTLMDRRPLHQNPAAFAYEDEEEPEPGSDLLPLPHLTATTILGAGAPERDTLGQLLATQVASAISARNPSERRLLVLGTGFNKEMVKDVGLEGERERQAFQELVGLCVGVL